MCSSGQPPFIKVGTPDRLTRSGKGSSSHQTVALLQDSGSETGNLPGFTGRLPSERLSKTR